MSILAYHKVDDRFEMGLTTVRPDRFKKHVRALLDSGHRIVDSPDSSEGETKTTCLTFDDAYECFHRNVMPFLLELNLGATLFVITDFIGKTNRWDVRLSLKPFLHMDAAQLREASSAGMEIGSHSCSHKDLTRLCDAELKNEVETSRKLIEDITGHQVKYISFPFGRHDERVVAAAREAGYVGLFGMGSRTADGVFARVPVYSIDSVAAVCRKAAGSNFEVIKSDFIHYFAGISALTSKWRTEKIAHN